MSIIGIESLVYGVDDVALCARFFEDFGLKVVSVSPSATEFELEEGSRVVLRSIEDPLLPESSLVGTGVREVVWGVDHGASLQRLLANLGRDRDIRRDADGTGHFLTDCGLPMALRLFQKKPVVCAPDLLNAPGVVNRLNSHRKWRQHARPRNLQHVVFTAVDFANTYKFFCERLGFRISDLQQGYGAYLRADGSINHHNLLLLNAGLPFPGFDGKPRFHHANFGVEDIDEMMVGANHMERCGWPKSVLGLGRHRIDSALFFICRARRAATPNMAPTAITSMTAGCRDCGRSRCSVTSPSSIIYRHFSDNRRCGNSASWSWGQAAKSWQTMRRHRTVLIVGGGIGGLCTSIGLARAGIETTIIEIKQDWTVYGVGIIQPSNQLRALAELGLAEACVARGGPFAGWEFCDAAGQVHAKVANPAVAAPQYPPISGIARPVLHDILTGEAARLGVTVKLGLTVNEIDSRPTDVLVRFSDGSEHRFDVVIGADGAHSKLRTLLFGEMRPTLNGLAVWRYNFPRPASMVWGSVHYAEYAKAGLVPMSPTTMYMFVVTPEPGNPRMPVERLHEAMRERLTDFTGIIGELREQIVEARGVVYKPMESLLLPAPWHRGRVLLIGDAVHATTPQLAQGASMAIEDSALLSQLLSQDRPVDDLFAEFMRRRYERCRYVVDTSLKFGRWELAEFNDAPEAGADPAALMADAGRVMAQPY